MQPLRQSPLPREYRTRANAMTGILGITAFAVSAFFIGAIRHGEPLPSIAILLLIMGFAAAAGLFSIWQSTDHESDPTEIRHLLRAGARAGVKTAFAVAVLVVLTTRLFASTVAAIAAVVPALLSILPAAFVAMLVTALAAGLRLPNSRGGNWVHPSRNVQLSKLTVVLAVLCFGMFLTLFALPKLDEFTNSRGGSQALNDAMLHNSLPHSEDPNLPNIPRSSFSYQPSTETPRSSQPIQAETPSRLFSTEPFLDTRSSPPPFQGQTPMFSDQTSTINALADQRPWPQTQSPSQSAGPRQQ